MLFVAVVYPTGYCNRTQLFISISSSTETNFTDKELDFYPQPENMTASEIVRKKEAKELRAPLKTNISLCYIFYWMRTNTKRIICNDETFNVKKFLPCDFLKVIVRDRQYKIKERYINIYKKKHPRETKQNNIYASSLKLSIFISQIR